MRITSPFGQDSWRSGDSYAICDECGFKYRRSELRKRWDNALVCHKDFELRHPQENLRAVPDRIVAPGEKRPDPTPDYRTVAVTQDDL